MLTQGCNLPRPDRLPKLVRQFASHQWEEGVLESLCFCQEERLQAVETNLPFNVPFSEVKQGVEAEMANLEVAMNTKQQERTRLMNMLHESKEKREPLMRQLMRKKQEIVTAADELLQNQGVARIPMESAVQSGCARAMGSTNCIYEQSTYDTSKDHLCRK